MLGKYNEKIKFKLFQMPYCGQLLCWVNPRLPNHCPECGTLVYMKLRFGADGETYIKAQDDNAWISYNVREVANVIASKSKEATNKTA